MKIEIYDIDRNSQYSMNLYCYISDKKYIFRYDGYDVRVVYAPETVSEETLKALYSSISGRLGKAPWNPDSYSNAHFLVDIDKGSFMEL